MCFWKEIHPSQVYGHACMPDMDMPMPNRAGIAKLWMSVHARLCEQASRWTSQLVRTFKFQCKHLMPLEIFQCMMTSSRRTVSFQGLSQSGKFPFEVSKFYKFPTPAWFVEVYSDAEEVPRWYLWIAHSIYIVCITFMNSVHSICQAAAAQKLLQMT